MSNPVGHPQCPFDFDEEKFIDAYVELFFTTPTIEEYFYGIPVVNGCEDHRLRVANDEPQEERSRKAKALFEERQLQLRDLVAEAEKFEYSYDDIISDITELFLSGEKMERNPESLGSSSKSLTTLFWNLGNWKRGKTGVCPVLSTLTRSTTRRINQMSFQIMFQRTIICFCRCLKI